MTESEWLPWYRRKHFKGKITEQEKRVLDSYRTKADHPATNYEELPDEVQLYISRIEIELHDKKKEIAVGIWLLAIIFPSFFVYQAFKGNLDNPTYSYLFAAAFFFYGLYRGWRDWKNADEELFPTAKNAPSPTLEGIRQEWEILHLAHLKRVKREQNNNE